MEQNSVTNTPNAICSARPSPATVSLTSLWGVLLGSGGDPLGITSRHAGVAPSSRTLPVSAKLIRKASIDQKDQRNTYDPNIPRGSEYVSTKNQDAHNVADDVASPSAQTGGYPRTDLGALKEKRVLHERIEAGNSAGVDEEKARVMPITPPSVFASNNDQIVNVNSDLSTAGQNIPLECTTDETKIFICGDEESERENKRCSETELEERMRAALFAANGNGNFEILARKLVSLFRDHPFPSTPFCDGGTSNEHHKSTSHFSSTPHAFLAPSAFFLPTHTSVSYTNDENIVNNDKASSNGCTRPMTTRPRPIFDAHATQQFSYEAASSDFPLPTAARSRSDANVQHPDITNEEASLSPQTLSLPVARDVLGLKSRGVTDNDDEAHLLSTFPMTDTDQCDDVFRSAHLIDRRAVDKQTCTSSIVDNGVKDSALTSYYINVCNSRVQTQALELLPEDKRHYFFESTPEALIPTTNNVYALGRMTPPPRLTPLLREHENTTPTGATQQPQVSTAASGLSLRADSRSAVPSAAITPRNLPPLQLLRSTPSEAKAAEAEATLVPVQATNAIGSIGTSSSCCPTTTTPRGGRRFAAMKGLPPSPMATASSEPPLPTIELCCVDKAESNKPFLPKNTNDKAQAGRKQKSSEHLCGAVYTSNNNTTTTQKSGNALVDFICAIPSRVSDNISLSDDGEAPSFNAQTLAIDDHHHQKFKELFNHSTTVKFTQTADEQQKVATAPKASDAGSDDPCNEMSESRRPSPSIPRPLLPDFHAQQPSTYDRGCAAATLDEVTNFSGCNEPSTATQHAEAKVTTEILNSANLPQIGPPPSWKLYEEGMAEEKRLHSVSSASSYYGFNATCISPHVPASNSERRRISEEGEALYLSARSTIATESTCSGAGREGAAETCQSIPPPAIDDTEHEKEAKQQACIRIRVPRDSPPSFLSMNSCGASLNRKSCSPPNSIVDATVYAADQRVKEAATDTPANPDSRLCQRSLSLSCFSKEDISSSIPPTVKNNFHSKNADALGGGGDLSAAPDDALPVFAPRLQQDEQMSLSSGVSRKESSKKSIVTFVSRVTSPRPGMLNLRSAFSSLDEHGDPPKYHQVTSLTTTTINSFDSDPFDRHPRSRSAERQQQSQQQCATIKNSSTVSPPSKYAINHSSDMTNIKNEKPLPRVDSCASPRSNAPQARREFVSFAADLLASVDSPRPTPRSLRKSIDSRRTCEREEERQTFMYSPGQSGLEISRVFNTSAVLKRQRISAEVLSKVLGAERRLLSSHSALRVNATLSLRNLWRNATRTGASGDHSAHQTRLFSLPEKVSSNDDSRAQSADVVVPAISNRIASICGGYGIPMAPPLPSFSGCKDKEAALLQDEATREPKPTLLSDITDTALSPPLRDTAALPSQRRKNRSLCEAGNKRTRDRGTTPDRSPDQPQSKMFIPSPISLNLTSPLASKSLLSPGSTHATHRSARTSYFDPSRLGDGGSHNSSSTKNTENTQTTHASSEGPGGYIPTLLGIDLKKLIGPHSVGASILVATHKSNSGFEQSLLPSASHCVAQQVKHTVHSKFQLSEEDDFWLLNDYILLGEVGRGRYGTVMVACSASQSAESKGGVSMKAVKIIPRSRLRGAYAKGSQESPSAFEHEMEVMKRLRHPNIVSLEEVIDDPSDANLYLVMPFIERGPVVKLDARGRCDPVPLSLLPSYMRQLLSAVAYLHRHKVVHCDIKPDNILLGGDGGLFLADFGVSEVFDGEGVTPAGTSSSPVKFAMRVTKGTPTFAAPETLTGDAYDGSQADLWAVGVCLYAFLFGCLPYDAGRVWDVFRAIEGAPVDLFKPFRERWAALAIACKAELSSTVERPNAPEKSGGSKESNYWPLPRLVPEARASDAELSQKIEQATIELGTLGHFARLTHAGEDQGLVFIAELRSRQLKELTETLLCEDIRRQVRDGKTGEGTVSFPSPDDDDDDDDDNETNGSDERAISARIRIAARALLDQRLERVSSAIGLVSVLLRKDACARPTALEALKHTFVSKQIRKAT